MKKEKKEEKIVKVEKESNKALISFCLAFVYFCLLLLGDFVILGSGVLGIIFGILVFITFISAVVLGIIAIMDAGKKDMQDKAFALFGIILPFIFTFIMLSIENGYFG